MAEMELEPSDTEPDLEATIDADVSMHTAAAPAQTVDHSLDDWLAFASSNKAAQPVSSLHPLFALNATPVLAEQQSPVTALVQQYEQTGSAKSHSKNRGLASLLDRSLFLSAGQSSALSKRAHLTQLELPVATVPGDGNPSGTTVDGTASDESALNVMTLHPPTQGAAARNDAAMAAHKARLHMKTHRKDQWGSRQSTAQPASAHTQPQQQLGPKVSFEVPDICSSQADDLCPERSSISLAWAHIRSHSSSSSSSVALAIPGSPMSPSQPPLEKLGRVALPTSLTQSQPSSPTTRPSALVTITDIMRQGSAAAGVHPWNAPPASPVFTRYTPAVTDAQIMRQNTLLSPLDFTPLSPAWPQQTLSSLRSGFRVAPLSSTSSNDGGWHADGSHDSRRDSPDCWSDPGASSLALTARGRVMLPPITPTHSGLLLSPGAQAQGATNR